MYNHVDVEALFEPVGAWWAKYFVGSKAVTTPSTTVSPIPKVPADRLGETAGVHVDVKTEREVDVLEKVF
jgi:hypothetical protein